jgi:four helix bundle protein
MSTSPRPQKIQSYRDLIAWQKAVDLAEYIHNASEKFPRREIFALTAQIRRATYSISSNIAEGQGRATTGDFLNFLSIARGSLFEVQSQVYVAQRLRYVDAATCKRLVDSTDELGRIINGLIKSLQRR